MAIAMFIVLVILTLFVTYWSASRVKSTTDFYAAGRSISSFQNGLAIAGEYMSAAAFLGISGLIAFRGIDGFLYSVSWLVAFVVVLFVIAESVRNTGRYTFADIVSYRLKEKPIRGAAAFNTLIISMLYMIPQMIAAGVLIRLLFGIPSSVAIVITGSLMTIYVMFGGMIATTWIQIIKAVLLLLGSYLLAIFTMAQFNFSINELFTAVYEFDPTFLEPGGLIQNPLDRVSLGIGLLFGTAALPHILMRFYTVSSANKARNSVLWGMTFIGLFQILTPIFGFGALLLVGLPVIENADKGGNLAAPLLAQMVGGGPGSVGGEFFMAFLSAIAFITIIAVVSGLALAASSAFAYDFWIRLVRGGKENHREQLFVSRVTALGVGAFSIIIALLLQNANVAYLTGLAFAIAATANLPVLVFSLYWRGLTTTGAITGMIGGLAIAIITVVTGPEFSGEHALFPLKNPGIVSIPAGFLLTFIASILTKKEPNADMKYKEVAVRSQTGIGAE